MPFTVSNAARLRALLPLAAVTAAAFVTSPSASAGVALSTSGWEWSDPSPQGYTLQDVQFQGQRGYAVGSGGTALRSDDGGATWSGLFTGTNTSINSIDIVDGGTVAVASGNDANCTIRISTDAGATFRVIPVGDNEASCSDSSFSAFDFVNANTGYVMRTGGSVLATTDGGESLGSRSAVDGGVSLRFQSEQVGYAASSNGKIYRTTDGAQTWNPIYDAGGPLSSIRLTGANDIIAWGKDRLVRSTDGGATFSPGAIAGQPTRASSADPTHLAFVADNKLLISDDGGVSIREVTLGNKDVLAASYVDATHIVAVGLGGVTYLSSDAGATFNRLSTDPVGGQIRTIGESAGGPYGLGDGKIGRIVNGQWVLRSTLTAASVIDADFSSQDRGYVLRAGNTLLRTTNNGTSWSPVDAGTTGTISLVVTPNDTTALLFGTFGIRRAVNGGSFDAVTSKLLSKFKVAGARSAGARVVTWSGKSKVRPLISANAGDTWKAIKMPKGVTRVSDLRPLPGKGLLLETSGRVFRSSSDAGKWTEITSLGTSPGGDSPGVTAASATEFFAGDGGSWPVPVVLHSTDSGKTWQPQAVGASGTSVYALAATAPKSAVALSGSGRPFENAIFATTTGGGRGSGTAISLGKTKSSLKSKNGRITVTGQLSGGRGGETVHVAIRKVGASGWTSANVIVGANGGGSFTASFKAKKGKYVIVGQWAGDSGRAGAGTSARTITVK